MRSNNVRFDRLGDGYTLNNLLAVLSGQKEHTSRKKTAPQAAPPKVNLLVDIQDKLKAGKGAGYARWAKVFNLKQMAQTLNYAKTRDTYVAYRKAGYSKKFRQEHEEDHYAFPSIISFRHCKKRFAALENT